MRDFEMALKLNSHYGLAYFNMGNVYFHHRQFQQVHTLYSVMSSMCMQDLDYKNFLTKCLILYTYILLCRYK